MKFAMSGRKKSGFTLIEVMSATVILVLIVMVISAVFHQSTIAWDTGNRKAESAMAARAGLGIISTWMHRAVNPTNSDYIGYRKTLIPNNGNSVEFVVLDMDGSNRAAKVVSVGQDGDEVKMMLPGSKNDSTLVRDVRALKFIRSDEGAGGSDVLPEYVNVRLELEREDRISGLGVISYGPNGKNDGGEDDDIRSW